MRLLPQRLWLRLVLAFAGALGVIIALEWSLRVRDARAAERSSPQRGAAAAADDPAGLADPVDAAESVRELGVIAAGVVLVARGTRAPSAGAVWQLLPSGRSVVRVPAPPPSAPGRQALAHVAIVLPVDRLSALDPVQRAGLLDLLSALIRERPIGTAQVDLAGIAAAPDDIAALLRWVH